MPYSLQRLSDGAGDSGRMSVALCYKDDGSIQQEENARPRVGVAMMVGSPFSRTLEVQDWWRTSLILEILEESENHVVFTTMTGSTYTWRCS
jgi:hypothetical protein